MEVGNLEKTITTDDFGEFVVKWVGKDTFTYDANGQIKAWVGEQEQTLRPQITWAENAAKDYDIMFISPDGVHYLADVTHYESTEYDNGSSKGFSMDGCMMNNMWVDFENTIHFFVETVYDNTKVKNTFTLEISVVGGQTYKIKKEIYFIKDGDQGTMGGDWTAPIMPTVFNPNLTHEANFVDEAKHPSPLVVGYPNGNAYKPAGGSFYGQQILASSNSAVNYNYRLFMRPFVKRRGIPIEEID